jgi:hypothetical protein
VVNAGTTETTTSTSTKQEARGKRRETIQDLILYLYEANKVEMQLADGRYACAVADSPARHSWDVSDVSKKIWTRLENALRN